MPPRQESVHPPTGPNDHPGTLPSLEIAQDDLRNPRKRPSDEPAIDTQEIEKKRRNPQYDKLARAINLPESNFNDPDFTARYRFAKLESLQYVRDEVGILLDKPFTKYTKMQQQTAEEKFRACIAKKGNKLGFSSFCSC